MADNQIEIKIKVQAEELKTALDEASGVVQKSMEKISGDFDLGFGQFKQASEYLQDTGFIYRLMHDIGACRSM